MWCGFENSKFYSESNVPISRTLESGYLLSIFITTYHRFIVLRKKPTTRKFLCGMIVLLSLFICLLPSIFPKQLDPHKGQEKGEGASGTAGVLWPLCFMIGFVSRLTNCQFIYPFPSILISFHPIHPFIQPSRSFIFPFLSHLSIIHPPISYIFDSSILWLFSWLFWWHH